MRTILILALLLAPVAWSQDPGMPEKSDKSEPEAKKEEPKPGDDESALLTATKLRGNVRTMRKHVLAGGPAVQKSEKEALRFYRKKINELARQTEELRTKRAMKEAEYEIALETTLKAEDAGERADAARQASKLRAEMSAIDADVTALERQGEMVGKGVTAIQKRMEARKRLLRRFDNPETYGEDLPYLSDELLEFAEEEESEGGDPFLDEGFIQDLLKRDEAAARSLLFNHDPIAYWKRFPLMPPRAALKRAIQFPPSDLPGAR